MDINISNGSCYQYYRSDADARYLPCGNTAVETQSCCFAGDACLDGGACAATRDGVNVTYVAGCTDHTYLSLGSSARRCPAKPANDSWTPVALCAGSPNDNRNDSFPWAACIVADHPTTIDAVAAAAAASSCACVTGTTTFVVTAATATYTSTSVRFVAFNAASSLRTTATLPTTAGGLITWAAGFTPTTPTTTTSSTGRAYTATAYPTFSSTSSGSSGTSEANALRIGFAVAGLVLAFAICAWAYFYGRRRSRQMAAAGLVPPPPPGRPAPAHEDIPLPKYTRDPGQDEQGVPGSSLPREQPPAYTR